MPTTLNTKKLSKSENILAVREDVINALKNCGTRKQFDEFNERLLKFYKKSFEKKTDPSKIPQWSGTFRTKSPKNWKIALDFLIDNGFPLESAYLEELAHHKVAKKQGLDTEFLLRFCENDDGSIGLEPSLATYNYNSSKNYAKKIIRAVDIPESSSKWDKTMLKLAEDLDKKPKPLQS